MQNAMVQTRVAGVAAFAPAKAQRRQQTRRQQRLAPLFVAAMEEPAVQAEAAEEPEWDREAAYARFEQLLDAHNFDFHTGDKVQGTVVRVDQRGAYIDIGGKSTAFCPSAELALANVPRATQVLGPHTAREFVVIKEERSGDLVLSIKRLEMQVAWQRLRQCSEDDVSVEGRVVGTNRGGLLVEAEGIRGFCPGSQLGQRVQSFDELLNATMSFKVTEVDEEKARLMLSNKRVAESERTAGFKVGDVVEGTVMSVKPYGAFVDIGGTTGLLHVSQISSERVQNVEKVLSEGDRLKVMILGLDQQRGRVTLSTKKLEAKAGDMLTNPQAVYENADKAAALFRERVDQARQAQVTQPGAVAQDPLAM